MRLSKIMLIMLVLSSISVLSLSCGSKSAPTPEGQVATVQRGDLSITITGVGNLALSQKVDLAFELPGTVAEVLVKEGESVKEGQVLARLDTSAWQDQVAALQDKVTQAERAVTKAERNVTTSILTQLQRQIDVNSAELALENTEEKSTDILEIQIAEAKLEVAKGNLEAAKTAIEDAKVAVEDAKKAVEDARKALAEAMKASPEVKATFAGFITKVNVKGGDEVKKGTVAVTLADPNKFQADIMVNEMDFPQVKLGGNASVRVDAMSGLSLSANVTHISPSATIQSGVVNYKVTVELQSLQPVSSNQTGQSQRPQSGTGGQAPSALTQVIQLREGMTVTVSILIEGRNDVLLVPIGAISSRGGQAYVRVQKDGIVEERSIKTGVSNGQYTEVTDGLSEGENVVIPQATTTTSTTSQQQRSPGGMIPIFR